jgi:hypothetical protein
VKDFDSGYDFDSFTGATYHFDHIPQADAEVRGQTREYPHVVETVNYTIADDGSLHLNRYYADNLDDAISLAARLQFQLDVDAEVITGIRPISPEEAEEFEVHRQQFLAALPDAASVPNAKKKGDNQ